MLSEFCLFFLLLAAAAAAAATPVDATEWAVLRDDVLPALGLPQSNASAPACSAAPWPLQLRCDSAGRVQVLQVVDTDLSGSLSARVAQLSQLRELVLRRTRALVGSVPTEWRLLRLRRLVVEGNALSGGLAHLDVADLQELAVAHNRFDGALPHPTRLGALERFDVAFNRFSALSGSRADWLALNASLLACRLSGDGSADDNCWAPTDCELLPPVCACVASVALPDCKRSAANSTDAPPPPRSTPALSTTTNVSLSTTTAANSTATTTTPCDLRTSCYQCVSVKRSVNASYKSECFWCFVEMLEVGFCQTVLPGVEPRCVGELQAFVVTCPVGDRVVDWSLLIVTAFLLTLAAFSALCVSLYISRMRIEQRSLQMRKAIQDQPVISEAMVDQLVNGPSLAGEANEPDDFQEFDDALDQDTELESLPPWASMGSRRNTTDIRRSRANTTASAASERRSRANTPQARALTPTT